MARLRFSAAARDDLAAIAEYVARKSGSRVVAKRFTDELRGKCRDLAAAPIRMGRPRPELLPSLRSHPHRRYVIFFRYVDDVLEIINVIEGHRDIGAFFSNHDT
jgi:plasmid stabilization system protein ParE